MRPQSDKPVTGGFGGVSDSESLLIEEQVVPSQLSSAISAVTLKLAPSAKLWVAALEDALRGALRSKPADLEWFKSLSEEVGSFRWVVLNLQLEPDAWQPRILRAIANGTRRGREKRNRC